MEAMAEITAKAAEKIRGDYRKTALGNSRWLLDDVLTEGLLKKLHCLTLAACRKREILLFSFCSVMQPYLVSLRNTRLESREVVRMTPPGPWMGDQALPALLLQPGWKVVLQEKRGSSLPICLVDHCGSYTAFAQRDL